MSESTVTMMAESGMPVNPYQYWTRHRAHDVLAIVNNEKGKRHEWQLARPDGNHL
jgi:gamma-glutamyltranspeptidase/glutathione hydrolase